MFLRFKGVLLIIAAGYQVELKIRQLVRPRTAHAVLNCLKDRFGLRKEQVSVRNVSTRVRHRGWKFRERLEESDIGLAH